MLKHYNVYIVSLLLACMFGVTGNGLRHAAAAAGTTYYVAQQQPQASDENPGTVQQPFATIAAAAKVLQPGDTVIVASGVYREHVAPIRGGSGPEAMLTYMAKPGATVIVKGSEVWQPVWQQANRQTEGTVVWQADLAADLFADSRSLFGPADTPFNPFVTGNSYGSAQNPRDQVVRPVEAGEPCQVTRGQIFVGGCPLWQVTSLEDLSKCTDAFFVAEDGGSVYVRLAGDASPSDKFVEITVREQIFAPRYRNLGYIRVKGFTMMHAANGCPFPQIGALSTRQGHHWTIEDNVVRFANTVGIDIGTEGWAIMKPEVWEGTTRGDRPEGPWCGVAGIVVRRNIVSDNGQAGIEAYGAGPNLLVADNLIERNNRLHFAVDSEAGGLKSHGVKNSIFRRNVFRDNDCSGLWLDGDADNNRITQNLFLGNMGSGCFLEACGRVGDFQGLVWNLVDNNIAAYTRPAVGGFYGDGFYVHSGGQAIFCHNLALGNAFYGIRIQYLDARFPTNAHHIFNNIILANGRGAVHIPPPSEQARDNFSDYNLFGPSGAGAQPAFGGGLGEGPGGPSPLVSFTEWQDAYGWDTHSVYAPDIKAQLWVRSLELELHAGPAADLQFPGIPPGVNQEPYQSPPQGMAGYAQADARDAWSEYGIDIDYFGDPRPQGPPPTPGPLQLARGEAALHVHLWPTR